MKPEVKSTIVISGNIQLTSFRMYIEDLASKYDLAGFVYNDIRDGTVKFACEGEASTIEELVEEIKKYPGVVKIETRGGILLPKPVGRVIVGIERDIFDRLDLGVARLGSIDDRLVSIESHLGSIEEHTGSTDSTLKDIRIILQKIAEK